LWYLALVAIAFMAGGCRRQGRLKHTEECRRAIPAHWSQRNSCESKTAADGTFLNYRLSK
jgi:hypothetical protein